MPEGRSFHISQLQSSTGSQIAPAQSLLPVYPLTRSVSPFSQFLPDRHRAAIMNFDFNLRLQNLTKVLQGLERMRELGFLVLSTEEPSMGDSGCRLPLESEFQFLINRPLEISCFADDCRSSQWISRTLLAVLGNLGIPEVFDTYSGPELKCSAICSESGTEIYIN